jgi:hypothetical protein
LQAANRYLLMENWVVEDSGVWMGLSTEVEVRMDVERKKSERTDYFWSGGGDCCCLSADPLARSPFSPP